MAKEEIFFGINIDTGKSIKTFGELKNRTKALKKELDGLKVGSKRFNDLQKEITANQATIRRFNRSLRDTKSLATRVGQGVTNAFKGVGTAFAGAFAAQGIFNFFKNASGTIADFEQQLAKVRAVTGATDEEFKKLSKSAKELGASSQFTATEVGSLQEEFAKLGFSTGEILNATEATLDLATATQTDLAQAATVAASTVRGFGLDAKETQRVTDVMAASFSGSALDINKFQTAMAAVAPVAKNAGVSIEETTSILGKIIDAGVDASTAGTGLRNIFLDLAEKGLTFEQAMNKINTSADKNATALELFGKRGATVATIIADNTVNIDEFTKALNEADGAASDMAKTVGDTLQGELKRLDSAWEGLVLSFEEGNGVLKDLTGAFADYLDLITATRNISKELDELGFESNFLTFDAKTVAIGGERLARLGSDAEKTADNLISLGEHIRQSIIDATDPKQLDELSKAFSNLSEEIAKTGQAAGDETGENAKAFQKLYINLSKEAGEAASSLRETIEANKKQQEKAAKDLEIQLKEARAKELEELRKKQEKERLLELEHRRLRAEIRLEGVEQAIEIIDIEFDTRRQKLIEAGLSEQEILIAELEAKQAIRDQFNEKQRLQEEDNQRKLLGLRSAQGEFEALQLKKKQEEANKEREINNARLEAQSAMLQGTISILSRDENARKKNAKLIKSLAIADVIVNTQRALQNVTTSATAPTPQNLLTNGAFGIATSTLQRIGIITQSLASIATISAQKFAKGGILQGASHTQGGIKTPFGELEGGEAVINKKSTKKYGGILSAINQAEGGVKFERGGLLGTPSTIPTADSTNAELLGAFRSFDIKPTVSVVEINEAQTRVSSIENNSTL